MTKPELKRVLKIVYILIKAYSGKKFFVPLQNIGKINA